MEDISAAAHVVIGIRALRQSCHGVVELGLVIISVRVHVRDLLIFLVAGSFMVGALVFECKLGVRNVHFFSLDVFAFLTEVFMSGLVFPLVPGGDALAEFPVANSFSHISFSVALVRNLSFPLIKSLSTSHPSESAYSISQDTS